MMKLKHAANQVHSDQPITVKFQTIYMYLSSTTNYRAIHSLLLSCTINYCVICSFCCIFLTLSEHLQVDLNDIIGMSVLNCSETRWRLMKSTTDQCIDRLIETQECIITTVQCQCREGSSSCYVHVWFCLPSV